MAVGFPLTHTVEGVRLTRTPAPVGSLWPHSVNCLTARKTGEGIVDGDADISHETGRKEPY